MSDTSSWRDLLRDIIADPLVRERLASAMGVHQLTLTRWANNQSNPRPHKLRQLLSALPSEQRTLMAELLGEEQGDFAESSLSDELDRVDPAFVMQVLELRETTSEVVLFWTLCNKVFQHALRQLDPERIGMAIRVVRCMPPGGSGKIHSLRESVGRGTPPWQAELEQEAILLGAESLAGFVVTTCRPEAVQDLSRETYRIPAHRAEYELSAMATPLLYANRIAGCVLVSSTRPNSFTSPSRLNLITGYSRLIALAFTSDQFYPPDCLELRMMPPFDVQRELLASFRDRVNVLMKETSSQQQPLSRTQAEQLVWQRFEEELILISSSKINVS